jgi:predicted membrane protein
MKFIAAIFSFALAMANMGLAQDNDLIYPPPVKHEMSVALFNQKDFSGWTSCMKDNADLLKTWSVTNGVIHCTGKPIGYLRTTQVYSNYFLTVVWRFVKIAPQADNTGVLVHIQSPDKIWPQCIKIQGKHGRQGDLFLMAGAESKEHRGRNKNTPIPLQGDSVEVPVGEWNKAETICVGNKVESFMNSKFVNETTECTISSGYIGIQSDGGDIEIRSIDYAPLKF